MYSSSFFSFLIPSLLVGPCLMYIGLTSYRVTMEENDFFRRVQISQKKFKALLNNNRSCAIILLRRKGKIEDPAIGVSLDYQRFRGHNLLGVVFRDTFPGRFKKYDHKSVFNYFVDKRHLDCELEGLFMGLGRDTANPFQRLDKTYEYFK